MISLLFSLFSFVAAQDLTGRIFQLADSGYCLGVDPQLQFCNSLQEFTSSQSNLAMTTIYNNGRCLEASLGSVEWANCVANQMNQKWKVSLSNVESLEYLGKCLSYTGLSGSMPFDSPPDEWKKLILTDCQNAPSWKPIEIETYTEMKTNRKFTDIQPVIRTQPQVFGFIESGLQNGSCHLVHDGYNKDGTAFYFEWRTKNLNTEFGLFKEQIIDAPSVEKRLDMLFQVVKLPNQPNEATVMLNNRCLTVNNNAVSLNSCVGDVTQLFQIGHSKLTRLFVP